MPGSSPRDLVEGEAEVRDDVPSWDLSPIFPSLASTEFGEAKERMAALARDYLAQLEALPAAGGLGPWLERALELEGRAGSLYETLGAYVYAVYSTDTGSAEALAQINAVEELGLPLKKAEVLFREALAARKDEVEALVGHGARLAHFAFHLREEIFWQSKQMGIELEDLAADLSRSGGDAWSRLRDAITASADAVWAPASGAAAGAAGPGRPELRKTLVELRNLAYDPDRAVREKAYRLELGICESLKTPGAAALNGVKGFSISLNARRGWDGALEKSTAQCRITPAALDALIGSLEESLPSWRRYLAAKARALGLAGRCAFYDLFAPLPEASGTYSFGEARDFIVSVFSAFDPGMGEFASRAFASRALDAKPRAGKVGGAYCADMPEAGVSRVLCNFDGTYNSASTMAHELGHAWHSERLRGQPYQDTRYPMTLAETASIFSETLLFEAALKSAKSGQTAGQKAGSEADLEAALLEIHLQDACQVIVDILSRFYFERAVFERRAKRELASEELCELMLEAQRATYGEGLDPALLHPYMWLVKGHYYSQDLAFYNFPYAFGQLFGAGLYARNEAEGPSFASVYRLLLEDSGRMSAVDVAARAGFDIEKPDFWRGGLSLFARQVEQFEAAV
jgi:pepF/M3 family oligoendopeptidase